MIPQNHPLDSRKSRISFGAMSFEAQAQQEPPLRCSLTKNNGSDTVTCSVYANNLKVNEIVVNGGNCKAQAAPGGPFNFGQKFRIVSSTAMSGLGALVGEAQRCKRPFCETPHLGCPPPPPDCGDNPSPEAQRQIQEANRNNQNCPPCQ